MDDEDDLAPVRNEVLNTIGDNAVSLAMPPAGEVIQPPADDGWAPGLTDDANRTAVQTVQGLADQGTSPLDFTASDQIDSAIGLSAGERAAARAAMKISGADKAFERTVSTITGGQFSKSDLKTLEDRLLEKADRGKDVGPLMGIQDGAPVYLTPAQKSVVDSLVGRLGSDPLAQRAQDAYRKALNAGQVRTR